MARRSAYYYSETRRQYRKRVQLPNGKQRDVWAKTVPELKAKLKALEAELDAGLILDDKTTVAELAAEWYRNRAGGVSQSRQKDWRQDINLRICPVIGTLRVGDVLPEDCQRVMASCAHYSNSVQTKTRQTMYNIFACGVANRLIRQNPAETCKAKGKKASPKVALTHEQAKELLEALQGTRAYLFVLLGLYTGLRREEICGLRWSDLDLDSKAPSLTVNGVVVFDQPARYTDVTKTPAAHRTLPLPPILCAALRDAMGKSISEWVISTQKGGMPTLSALRNITSQIDRHGPETPRQATIRAKREQAAQQARGGKAKRSANTHPDFRRVSFHVTPHQLRHTYITWLIQGGVDIKKVQYLAGHKDIRMTLDIYAKVMGNRPEELIDLVTGALPDLVGRNPVPEADPEP